MGYVLVPLYDTLGEAAIEYIIDHSEAVFIAASHAKLPQLAAAIPNLKTSRPLLGVTVWGSPADASARAAIANAGIKVTAFDDLLASSGTAPLVPANPPAPSDLSTIMYTSGTTGNPKGVMLTHAGIVATVQSLWQYLAAHNISIAPGMPPHCQDAHMHVVHASSDESRKSFLVPQAVLPALTCVSCAVAVTRMPACQRCGLSQQIRSRRGVNADTASRLRQKLSPARSQASGSPQHMARMALMIRST